jgi:uncharacterized protein (DUF697 family)
MILSATNQAMMIYRLAACFGMDLDPRARAGDVMPLAGNAFGWRAVAREIVGVVPGGVGVVGRGAIAYAGTVALGEAMHRYYALGERPTRYVLSALYRQSIAEAREVASGMLRRLRSTRKPRRLLRGKESADGA